MTDESGVKQRAAEQRQQFQETHGYPAVSVPEMWVGQNVAMNMLGPMKTSGRLEAVREDGFVITHEERTVFIPRSAVLQIELHDPDRRDRKVRVRR